MKWKDADFKSGIGTIRAVLIYGPDAGQVDEYCDLAISTLGIEKDNLFALDSDDLREKQDALFAEACSPSMFGGQKMVLISNAGDSCAKSVEELVSHSGLCATVVVAGGDLRAGGGLRTLFEGADNMAALACYTDDARTLANLIRNELSAASGIAQITPDAMVYMTTHLGGDRGITRSFLNKIALYVHDKRIVELSDVEKCLPDTGAADMDDFLFSLTAGHIQQTMMALDRLFYDNKEPNMLVRMLDMHFKRLQTAVVDGHLPRLFWKVEEKFKQAMRIWSDAEITAVLIRLNELERQLRTTGMPAEVLLRDFALKLSVRSAKLAIKKRN
ncbi:MAG: DNA polymerase III subunit delta [Alphaproteobacteria bacterium]|nr:DNA polymerase III subunit delta [Alphaproteobacteria bacterium]MBR6684797.1 DNA polymerase III subunit delta [Alphaproteobacteria bacterium]